MHLHPYLIFPGTCREALTHYEAALRGTIDHLQTVGESHLPHAPEHASRIFHSNFVAGDVRFGASDGEVGKDPVIGQNFSMFLTIPDAERQGEVFEALAEGGSVIFPLNQGFGMVEDRFGIRWMIATG